MDFTDLFLKVAKTYPEFAEACELVKANSSGRIWLIGGFVCRSLIQALYDIPMPPEVDFDFIVEKAAPLNLPVGWEVKQNNYGNPKLIGPKYKIDYIPLTSLHSIIRRQLEPTIENQLTGTPLNVQSIAFEMPSNQIIGEIGIRAIKEKVIAVNNREQAEYRAKLKGVTVADLITDIAIQFKFTPVYPKI